MTDTAELDRWPGVRRNEPLSRHSQYGIGGPADWFLGVSETATLCQLQQACHAMAVPLTVIGAGSNTLILDDGIEGLVIRLTDRRLRRVGPDVAEISGGYLMPRAALDCAKEGLAGVEFGIGIPGTCGASVRGNAGAFGSGVADTLVECDVVTERGELKTYPCAECHFTYRDSIFKHERKDTIVVAGRFRVHDDDPTQVRQRTDAIQAERKATQPYGIRSLGSVFKNPDGDHAGRLIEAAGLKGARRGGAEISTRHANFIVNRDAASAADVLELIALAHDRVQEKFGVNLEREIVIAGRGMEAMA